MSNLKEKIDFVNGLYGLMLEANLNRSDDEIMHGIDIKADPYLDQSLSFIRQLNTKAKAQLNKSRFNYAQQMLAELLNKTGDNLEDFLKGILSEPENKEMLAFFSNFQSLSETDKKAMLLDNKILEIISKAKNELDSSAE